MFRFGYTMDGPQVGYWGARAIYQGSYYDYYVDIVANRCSGKEGMEISDEFLAWLNETAIPWLRKEVKEQQLSIATPKLLTLEDGRFELKANTNGSYGYLYIGAIEKAEEVACVEN